MSCCGVACAISLLVVIISIVYIRKRKTQAKLLKRIESLKETFSSAEVAEVKPYKVEISEDDLKEIKTKLSSRRVVQDITDEENMPYGLSVEYVNNIAEYWGHEFDFSSVKRTMDQFDHFTTKIGGIDVHFIHQAGPEGSIPIMLLHGWPSTVWEFHKSIPLLVKQGYSIVCPSIPGIGFSSKPCKPGTSPAVIACIYHQIMSRLGYGSYVIHGGDWGALIGRIMSILFPSSVTGLHLTMNLPGLSGRFLCESLLGKVAPSLVYTTEKEYQQVHPMSEAFKRWYDSFGYFHIQSTIPDCIGAGMMDSPTGLIGWIGMMYAVCASDRLNKEKTRKQLFKEGVANFGIDNICAMLTIYWCTRTIQSSMRLYAEFWRNDRELLSCPVSAAVPVGMCNFPNEITHYTKFSSQPAYHDLRRFSYFSSGGHFANIDNTEAVVGDLIEFISEL